MKSKLYKIEVFCQKLQKFTLRFNTCCPIYAKVLAMGSNCSTTNAFLKQRLCFHTFEHLWLRNKNTKSGTNGKNTIWSITIITGKSP